MFGLRFYRSDDHAMTSVQTSPLAPTTAWLTTPAGRDYAVRYGISDEPRRALSLTLRHLLVGALRGEHNALQHVVLRGGGAILANLALAELQELREPLEESRAQVEPLARRLQVVVIGHLDANEFA